ncbi:MAG: bifunctional oligoribonuclease/PAP phosphatase NrnA [Bacteroidota bacterium]|nr:bifunctional oligoribonuclease/PAP phosphatase NrnA [Bacteroidota bacterium]
MENIRELKKLIFGPSLNIVITTHQKPDADALGSSLALYGYLKQYNHKITVISPTDYPRFIQWMPCNHCVIDFEASEKNNKLSRVAIEKADLIFYLDFSSVERLKDVGPFFEKASGKKVLVDHHLDPSIKADFVLWNSKAAATCELIYELIVMLGDKSKINIPIGECIYAGIMTDTGSFRFPSTSKKVHLIIANLIELGVDNSKIHRLVYDNNSHEKLMFLGFVLSQKMKIIPEYCTAYIVINKEELATYHSQTGDTEGLVNYALSIENIEFATIIIERPDAVKLSFRSSGNFKVNEFASKHFEGGGHKNASGGKSSLSLAQTVEKFIELLPYYKEELTLKQNQTTNLLPC